MLQLHGDEGPAFCSEAARRTGCKVIKAARVRSGADIQALAPFHTDYHLLDSYTAGVPGGTGETFAWEIARASPRHRADDPSRRPEPRQRRRGDRAWCDRSRSTSPAGSSSSPGRKDPDKLEAFAAAVASTAGAAAERAMSAVEHRFGPYGGQYVPETLMPALAELEDAWVPAREDPDFRAELDALLRDYVGRPSPLYLASRLSEAAGHPIYLKREDLNHTGAHKINNALGQALLAKRMGKTRIIAETGRRPARRRHGDRVRAARPRVRRLHGHRGHAPPEAQRRADGAARRARRAGRGGRADAEGGGLGGDPRLGRERRERPTTSSARASARRRTRRSCATCSG